MFVSTHDANVDSGATGAPWVRASSGRLRQASEFSAKVGRLWQALAFTSLGDCKSPRIPRREVGTSVAAISAKLQRHVPGMSGRVARFTVVPLVAFAAALGCKPIPLHPDQHKLMQRGGWDQRITVEDGRYLRAVLWKEAELQLQSRDGRDSRKFFAAAAYTSTEALCVDVIIAPIDLISRLVVRNVDDSLRPTLHVSREVSVEERSPREWTIKGDSAQLAAWLVWHGKAVRRLPRRTLAMIRPATYAGEFRPSVLGSESASEPQPLSTFSSWALNPAPIAMGWPWGHIEKVLPGYPYWTPELFEQHIRDGFAAEFGEVTRKDIHTKAKIWLPLVCETTTTRQKLFRWKSQERQESFSCWLARIRKARGDSLILLIFDRLQLGFCASSLRGRVLVDERTTSEARRRR